MARPPVICICGKKNSGKTTLIERLIPRLAEMGLKVATLKHDRHGFDMDVEGKDTWRHRKAGAFATAISSPWSVAMISSVDREPGIQELVELVGKSADLVLAEGFKTSNAPKIEVVRAERSTQPICTAEDRLIAVATDVDGLSAGVPVFHIDDVEGLAGFIARRLGSEKSE